MADDFDVVVLGTGNAGMGAAGVTRAAGKSVAMVESWDVGGTCPLRGCVPKKVLVAAAQVLHQIEIAPAHHIDVGKATLDWAKLIEREQGFVDGVPAAFAGSLESRGIELIRGEARFVGPRAIEVGGRRLEGGKIVIATGSRPRDLSIPGFDQTITSNDILESPHLPDSIAFIGGGVIALEFSHVYARAGVKVTILEAMPRILPRLEPDLVAEIEKETRRIGVEVFKDVRVERIEKGDGGLVVHFTHESAAKSITAEVVANGAGRVADVERLDLDAAGVEHEGPAIKVDDYLRSVSNPDVYVAGDALSTSAQLSPVATFEGRIAGRNILDESSVAVDYTGIPGCVYTVPAAAMVGLTEIEAGDRGLAFQAKVNDLATWRSSTTHAETASWAKVLVEEETGRILGAHLIGHGAEEIVHFFALAIKQGLTAADIGEMVFAYPTFTSDIKHML